MNNIKNINYEKKYLKYKIKYNNLKYTGGAITPSTNEVIKENTTDDAQQEKKKSVIAIYKQFITTRSTDSTGYDLDQNLAGCEVMLNTDDYKSMIIKFNTWYHSVLVSLQMGNITEGSGNSLIDRLNKDKDIIDDLIKKLSSENKEFIETNEFIVNMQTKINNAIKIQQNKIK